MIWHFHWKKKRKSFLKTNLFFPGAKYRFDFMILDFPLNNTSSGRYLMSRYSNSGTRENHSKLSTWSKHSIQEVLQDPKMSYCLHQSRHKFCGDGILQAGEVSDLKNIYLFMNRYQFHEIFSDNFFRNVIVVQWRLVFPKNLVVFNLEEVPKIKNNAHGMLWDQLRNIAMTEMIFLLQKNSRLLLHFTMWNVPLRKLYLLVLYYY